MVDEKKLVLTEVRKHNRKIEHLSSLNKNLIYWDTLTSMPEKALNNRAELVSFLYGELLRLYRNKDYMNLVSMLEFWNEEVQDQKIFSMVRKIKSNFRSSELIPEDEFLDYQKTLAEAEKVWEYSREMDSFNILVPHLEKIIAYLRKKAEYIGYDHYPYDAILRENNPNYDFKRLESMFENIKVFSLDLLDEIRKKDLFIDQDILKDHFPKDKQILMTEDILKKLGFDFQLGRLDEGSYPTVLPVSNKDVRILSSYFEKDFTPAFTTALHTGSQAIYEQCISSDLSSYLLAEPASMIIMEAVASFYENILGKSRPFWDFYYPSFQSLFPSYKKVGLEEFYRALNKVQPSLIRVDADELTYNIHIIIRFELESMLINGSLEVRELPSAWNKKYRDYLGIEPTRDLFGVLQDVHWVSGYFGYFPNYLLGNIAAAQIFHRLGLDIPNLEDEVRSGNWNLIKDWFDGKIFSHGALYNTDELINVVTDETLDEKYFLNYLREKYINIYNI